MGMIARILYIYDLKGLENLLTAGVGGGIVGQIMTILGKSAVAQLLKFIPGVNILAALISGTVASGLTSALGEAVNFSCYKLYESVINGNTNIGEQVQAFGDMVFKYAKEAIESKKDKDDYKSPD